MWLKLSLFSFKSKEIEEFNVRLFLNVVDELSKKYECNYKLFQMLMSTYTRNNLTYFL